MRVFGEVEDVGDDVESVGFEGNAQSLLVLAILDATFEDTLDDSNQTSVQLCFFAFDGPQSNVAVNGLGCSSLHLAHSLEHVWCMQLTDYGFDIFFGPRNATVMFERAPRTKSKRERLIVFAEVVVDFAGQERCGRACVWCQIRGLFQGLARYVSVRYKGALE